MPGPDNTDDSVIARYINEAALASAITSDLFSPGDDARCQKNFRNGHIIERYLNRSHAERVKNNHTLPRERSPNGSKRYSSDDIPARPFQKTNGEKNGNGLPAAADADLLWLDDPQTLYLKKKLHIHDSVTFTSNLAHFFSSACVRDAIKKVRLLSDLKTSADQVRYPVFAVDNDGKVIAWNRALEEMSGTPAHDMIGKGIVSFATTIYGHPRPMLIDYLITPLSRFRHTCGKNVGSDEIITGEKEIVRLPGGLCHIRCKARYIHDDEGTIIGAIQSIGILDHPSGSRKTGTSRASSGNTCLASFLPPDLLTPNNRAATATAILQGTPAEKAAAGQVLADGLEDLHRAFGRLSAAEDDLLRNVGTLSGRQNPPGNRSPGREDPDGLNGRVIADAREGIIVFDLSLRCILWNPFMEGLTGMCASDVIGKQAFDMFPDLRNSDADLLLREALSGRITETSDISFRNTLIGKQAWIRLLFSALHDSSGKVAGIIAVVQDTTARKVMEYALESTIVQVMESEEKYRSVFHAKNDPLILVDIQDQRILDLNEAASELYGYSPGEFCQLPLRDLFVEPERYEDLLVPQARGVLMYRQRRKDGTLFPADISFGSLELRGREVLLLSIRDTTAVHDTSEALRLANTKLNLLIGITRHDIINNLTVVMGYNDLLRETVRDERVLAMLEKEENALRIIQRQIEFTRQYYNLGVKSPFWQNVCDISSMAYSQLVTTIPYACDTRDLEIYADPLLEKVFYNLFDNAVRHGDSVFHIRMYCTRDGADLLLLFGDDGIGISPENKERIFRKGFGSNTGLGLFLTREILAITRIEITETGEFEKGARFELRIPAGNFRFPDTINPLAISGSEKTDIVP